MAEPVEHCRGGITIVRGTLPSGNPVSYISKDGSTRPHTVRLDTYIERLTRERWFWHNAYVAVTCGWCLTSLVYALYVARLKGWL